MFVKKFCNFKNHEKKLKQYVNLTFRLFYQDFSLLLGFQSHLSLRNTSKVPNFSFALTHLFWFVFFHLLVLMKVFFILMFYALSRLQSSLYEIQQFG